MPNLMPNEWRFVLDQNGYSFMNMAIDEAIALCSSSVIARSNSEEATLKERIASPSASACNDGESKSTIRFYTWEKPAVSIGYFQRLMPVIEWLNQKSKANKGGHRASIDIVRRPTGGGVVSHGTDLTYSVVVRQLASTRNLIPLFYRQMGQAVIEGLRLLGINASLELGVKGQESMVADPRLRTQDSRLLLCAQTPVEFDVLVEDIKVAGCAARRLKTTLLFQGYISIGHVIDLKPHQITDALVKGFEVALNIELLKGKLTDEERALADKLNDKKYSRNEWNYKR